MTFEVRNENNMKTITVLTLRQYYMGRDRIWPIELTPEKQVNAATCVERTNALIAELEADGIKVEASPISKTPVSSGWRPAAVNGTTPGAAVRSKHMSCEAIDLYDPEGDIDEWALAHPGVLEKIGLWQEHPSSTKGWAHFQIVPPRSGNRVFYP
jgi:hypothetical protein